MKDWKSDGANGSGTLVFLPLKYEIDDSVTVTVVLLGDLIIATVVLLFML